MVFLLVGKGKPRPGVDRIWPPDTTPRRGLDKLDHPMTGSTTPRPAVVSTSSTILRGLERLDHTESARRSSRAQRGRAGGAGPGLAGERGTSERVSPPARSGGIRRIRGGLDKLDHPPWSRRARPPAGSRRARPPPVVSTGSTTRGRARPPGDYRLAS